jgi:Rrf2 family protein
MELTLTRRGDYVLQAALALARSYRNPDPPWRKIRELATDTLVPRSYLSQILGLLLQADLVESQAGKRGGYRLRRTPDHISLLEIVEAGEGPLRSSRCTLRGGPCQWEPMCPLHPTWSEVTDLLRTKLSQTSLARVLEVDQDLSRGTYPIPADSHRLRGAKTTAANTRPIP